MTRDRPRTLPILLLVTALFLCFSTSPAVAGDVPKPGDGEVWDAFVREAIREVRADVRLRLRTPRDRPESEIVAEDPARVRDSLQTPSAASGIRLAGDEVRPAVAAGPIPRLPSMEGTVAVLESLRCGSAWREGPRR